MNIKERFENVGFTPEEKLDLTARLERAAEQEENMTDATKRRIKRISGGMVFGVAAAVVMTAGALAAALNPGLRTWFDTTAPGASSALEDAVYRIDRSQTYNGWTVTLAECAGDDSSAYIWADITAPEGTVLAPPEGGYLNLLGGVDIQRTGSSSQQLADQDPTDNRVSLLIEIHSPSADLRGRTASVTLDPIVDVWYTEDPETGEEQRHKGSELTEAVRDHEWVFEDVKLDYPDQTIRLEPNIEVPWLDGTTTVTRLEVSPLSVYVTLEGGSCAAFVEHSREPDTAPGEVIVSSGGFTVTGGITPDQGWEQKRREMEKALTLELTLLDGTKLAPYNYTSVQEDYREGIPYVSFGRKYDYANYDLYKMFTRVLDPAQVDHVTICGVDIPLHPEDGAK